MAKHRSIPFSGPMVRAILDGRKTQTRPITKPQPIIGASLPEDSLRDARPCRRGGYEYMGRDTGLRKIEISYKPYAFPGDILWVREPWFHEVGEDYENAAFADGTLRDKKGMMWQLDGWTPTDADIWRKRRSIHMPRWASRITLEVTDVRIERVQEITAGDARAEGVSSTHDSPLTCGTALAYRPVFQELWESLYAKRGCGWKANPWVWVITFKRIESDAR